jgi:glutathione-regulated potassium-efflux system ancillary protein KefC
MDLIWVSTAFVMGWLGARVGLPPLVGYLLAGFGLFALGVRACKTSGGAKSSVLAACT